MLRIRIRNWVRRQLQAGIKCGPRDRGTLDELPWLTQLIPLGCYMSQEKQDGSQITYERADRELLFSSFPCDHVFFVSADGKILLKARTWITVLYCTLRKAEVIHKALKRLGPRADNVRFVVIVESPGLLIPFPCWASIKIRVLPKNESTTAFVARLVEEQRIMDIQSERAATEENTRRYNEGRSGASAALTD